MKRALVLLTALVALLLTPGAAGLPSASARTLPAVPASRTPGPMPDGVPSAEVGPLELDLSGPQVYQDFPPEQWGSTCAAAGSFETGSGTVGLTTTGVAPSCAQLRSPAAYTYGVFQATVWLPDAGKGLIANWPAFWLDSANLSAWPQGGEWDIMEGLAGYDASHYFYGGTPEDPLSVRFPASGAIPDAGPGWHTVTGVWRRGYIAEYLDGHEVFSSTDHVVTTPMIIVLSMDCGSYGYTTNAPSTMWVRNVSVWRAR
jgi:hypothetical protein